jgi:hypothetical protein
LTELLNIVDRTEGLFVSFVMIPETITLNVFKPWLLSCRNAGY